MSEGSRRICRPFHKGLDGCCKKKWLLMRDVGKRGLKRSVGKGQEDGITKCRVIFVSLWDTLLSLECMLGEGRS